MSDITVGKIEQLTSGTASGYPQGLAGSPAQCQCADKDQRIADLEAQLATANEKARYCADETAQALADIVRMKETIKGGQKLIGSLDGLVKAQEVQAQIFDASLKASRGREAALAAALDLLQSAAKDVMSWSDYEWSIPPDVRKLLLHLKKSIGDTPSAILAAHDAEVRKPLEEKIAELAAGLSLLQKCSATMAACGQCLQRSYDTAAALAEVRKPLEDRIAALEFDLAASREQEAALAAALKVAEKIIGEAIQAASVMNLNKAVCLLSAYAEQARIVERIRIGCRGDTDPVGLAVTQVARKARAEELESFLEIGRDDYLGPHTMLGMEVRRRIAALKAEGGNG